MGGCRCTFRECENSSSTKPGMHFFHFPIRDWPRLEIWAHNADKLDFKDLPMSKLKNKVVCQEHFENKMFMNYLKEGLVKTAIPRLQPLQDGSVWNVETNQIGEREEWVLPEEKNGAGETETVMATETTRMEIQFVDSEHEEFNITPVISPPPPPIILNKTSSAVPVRILAVGGDDPKMITPTTAPSNVVLRKVLVKRKHKPTPENSPVKQKMQVLSIQRLPKISPNFPKVEQQPEKSITEEVPSVATPSSSTDVTDETPTVEDQIQPSSSPALPPPPTPPPPAPPVIKVVSDPAYIEKLDHTSTQIAEVKKLLIDVLNKPVPEPKVITVPVPTPVPAPPQPEPPSSAEENCSKMEKGPHMNKVQLFNGIKRYLNPTMVALLRMELFAGAPERQWKADEKTLAVELANLGENVYTHFLEEFRFRLPAKKDAMKWKEEALDDDDDAS